MIGNSMTVGAPYKHILKFTMPILLGSVLQQLYNTVDTIVVGNFSGELSLSAVGTTATITFMFLAIAMGFSNGNGVVVAQYHGAGDETKLRKTVSTGFIMILSMGLIMTIIGLVFARPIFAKIVDVPEEILEETLIYFRVFCLGLIFQFGYNVIASSLRAVGDSKATLYFLLISSVLNIGLDIWFVAGLGWGVMGAAVATDISQAVSFVCGIIYMFVKYPVFRFSKGDFTFDKECASKSLSVGFPMAIQLIIVSTGLTFIQRAVNGFGSTMTAAFTVGHKIEMYMNLPGHAFETALATYAGQNMGAKRPDRVKTGSYQGVAMSFAMAVVLSLIIHFVASPISSIFGLGEQARIYSIEYMNAICIENLILALYIPMFGIYQGCGHGSAATFMSLAALAVRVAVTYLFRYTNFFGYSIVWWNGLFGFTAGMIVTWIYFYSGRWKKNNVIKN